MPGVIRRGLVVVAGLGAVLVVVVLAGGGAHRVSTRTAEDRVRVAARRAGAPLAEVRCARNEDAVDNFLCVGEYASGEHFSAKVEVHSDGALDVARP